MAQASRFTPQMTDEYIKKGYWENITLSDYWERNAKTIPDREAIADSNSRLTWSQANILIDRLALGLLEEGFKRDELIIIQLPNCVELSLLRVACERMGLLCLPVLRTYRERELEYSISYTEAAGMVIPSIFKDFDYYQMAKELQRKLGKPRKILVVGDEVPSGCVSLRKIMSTPLEKKYPAAYLQDRKCKPGEFSLVTITSGSTGLPKYAENPLYTRLHTARLFHIRPDDICAALSPAATGPNQGNYYGAPQVGAKVVWLEAFEAEEAFRLMQREKVTYMTAVPAQLALMIRHPAIGKCDFSSLRLILSTGAFLAYHVGLEAEEKFGCPVIQTYGAVDVGGISIGDPAASRAERLLTSGKPLRGAEVKMVDDNGKEVARGSVGEICVRGPTTVSGFYKDPEATARMWSPDGWTKVGDLGQLDEKGNIHIMGRKKDMIIRGGQNIYPAEIENLLLQHPRVFSVAVVGMPDPIMGEKACAYIVPKPGQTFSFVEMVSYMKSCKIATFKLPERLEVISKMPMLAEDQKVDKKVLQRDIEEKLKAASNQ